VVRRRGTVGGGSGACPFFFGGHIWVRGLEGARRRGCGCCGGGGGLDCWREDKHAAKTAKHTVRSSGVGWLWLGCTFDALLSGSNGHAAKTPEPLPPSLLPCAPQISGNKPISFAPVCHPQHNIVPCLATTQHF
jgi:hypothetical protein